MRIFHYLGDNTNAYRTLMKEQIDLQFPELSIPVNRIVIADQTHSDLVHICREEDAGAGFANHPQIPIADALITDIPNLFLLIRTADCTPVIIYDPTQNVVAAIHSGREGTRKNICGKTCDVAKKHYACEMQNLKAIIGAGICARHYEVSPDIWNHYQDSVSLSGINIASQYRHPDIRATIHAQLLLSGIPEANITHINTCTFEDQDFFSFRRDGTNNRQINLIGVSDAKDL